MRVPCANFQGKLPDKLGELLSSMYLIGCGISLRNPSNVEDIWMAAFSNTVQYGS